MQTHPAIKTRRFPENERNEAMREDKARKRDLPFAAIGAGEARRVFLNAFGSKAGIARTSVAKKQDAGLSMISVAARFQYGGNVPGRPERAGASVSVAGAVRSF